MFFFPFSKHETKNEGMKGTISKCTFKMDDETKKLLTHGGPRHFIYIWQFLKKKRTNCWRLKKQKLGGNVTWTSKRSSKIDSFGFSKFCINLRLPFFEGLKESFLGSLLKIHESHLLKKMRVIWTETHVFCFNKENTKNNLTAWRPPSSPGPVGGGTVFVESKKCNYLA